MKTITGYEGLYYATEDGEIFSQRRPRSKGGLLKGLLTTDGYKAVFLSKNGSVRRFKVHHLIALAFIGPRPKGMVIDHINNNRLDNSPSNLRYVTPRQNAIYGRRCEMNANRTSKYVGVFFSCGRWSAVKSYGGVQYNLGRFDNELEAHVAYENATEKSCVEQREARRASQASQFVGVTFDKSRKKWCARLKKKYIGRFETEKEAIDAIRKLQ